MHTEKTQAAPQNAPSLYESESGEKKRESTDVTSEAVSAEAAAAAEEEDRELDPVALNKSFKLAAWSSIALVRLPLVPTFFLLSSVKWLTYGYG